MKAKKDLYDDRCDRCGADSQHLFVVDDSDRSVGYVGTLFLCRECLEKSGNRLLDESEAQQQFCFYDEQEPGEQK